MQRKAVLCKRREKLDVIAISIGTMLATFVPLLKNFDFLQKQTHLLETGCCILPVSSTTRERKSGRRKGEKDSDRDRDARRIDQQCSRREQREAGSSARAQRRTARYVLPSPHTIKSLEAANGQPLPPAAAALSLSCVVWEQNRQMSDHKIESPTPFTPASRTSHLCCAVPKAEGLDQGAAGGSFAG